MRARTRDRGAARRLPELEVDRPLRRSSRSRPLLLGAITFGLRPLDESPATYLALFVVLVVTGFVAVAMGLLISALVSSEDQATSFIPLALIPQLLFGGAIVAVAEMSGAMQQLSKLVFSRWSFADIGAAIDMGGRIRDSTAEIPSRYPPEFFELPLWRGIGILVIFLFGFLGDHLRDPAAQPPGGVAADARSPDRDRQHDRRPHARGRDRPRRDGGRLPRPELASTGRWRSR